MGHEFGPENNYDCDDIQLKIIVGLGRAGDCRSRFIDLIKGTILSGEYNVFC
jgi:hypothetical protein